MTTEQPGGSKIAERSKESVEDKKLEGKILEEELEVVFDLIENYASFKKDYEGADFFPGSEVLSAIIHAESVRPNGDKEGVMELFENLNSRDVESVVADDYIDKFVLALARKWMEKVKKNPQEEINWQKLKEEVKKGIKKI